jgi:aspartyl-tRNA(Asn)/glutamyl-tRNA(Gln) amidotransferase subunit A
MRLPGDLSVAGVGRSLARREYSSRELTEALLARIVAAQPALNAFITISADLALAAASEADRQRAAGTTGPLLGVPLAHKDIFCTAGVLTTCGSKMLADFVAPYDATVAAKLKAAGTVMVGKTNMDEFAMGSSNETSHFGPVKNPWRRSAVPGVPSVSRRHCAASPVSSPPMGAFRVTA